MARRLSASPRAVARSAARSEEHTSELQSQSNLVCRLLLEKKKTHAASKHSRHAARVQSGLDVLESQKFAPLRGKHVGLINNHNDLYSQWCSNVAVSSQAVH